MNAQALALADRFDDLAGRVRAEAESRAARLAQIAHALRAAQPVEGAESTLLASAGALDTLRAELAGLLQRVQAVESERERRHRYSEAWFGQRVEPLLALPEAPAGPAWTALALDLLQARQLTLLERVLMHLAAHDGVQAPHTLLQQACAALLQEDRQAAVEPLRALWRAAAAGAPPFERVDPAVRTGLLVLAGQQAGAPACLLRPLMRARRTAPADGVADAALADLYRLQGRGSQAMAHAQQAAEMAPALPQAQLALGACLEAAADLPRAEPRYRQAAELAADAPDPVAVFERPLAPVSARAWLALAQCLAERGSAAAARASDLALRAADAPPTRSDVLALRGRLALARGERSAAAAEFAEAGRLRYQDSDFPGARPLLEQALALDPSRMDTHWVLADALVLQSYRGAGPRRLDEAALHAAEAAWERARTIALPQATGHAWAYFTRALICEQRAGLDDTDLWTELWAAVAWVEQEMLLETPGVTRWSTLGSLFRRLGMDANALRACQRALALDPQDLRAIEEQCAVHTNRGDWAEALDLIDRRFALGHDDPGRAASEWHHAVKSLILNGLQRYDEMLPHAQTAAERDPGDLWYRLMWAIALRRSGRLDDARRELRHIQSYRGRPGYASVQTNIAEALLMLAALDGDRALAAQAAQAYEALAASEAEASEARRGQGAALLLAGEPAAARPVLAEGIALARGPNDLESLERQLDDIAPHADADALAEARALIARRRGEVHTVPGCEAELRTRLRQARPPVRGGMLLTLARLLRDEDRAAEAAACAAELLDDPLHFPVAPDLLRLTIDAAANAPQADLPLLAGLAERLGDPRRVARLWSRAAARARPAGPAAIEGPTRRALQALQAAGLDAPAAAAELVDGARPALHDAAALWALADAWGAVDAASPVLAAARQRLPTLLDGLLGLDWPQEPGDLGPLPLLLALGAGLVPADPDTRRWPLFARELPALRERLELRLGLRLPGVRVREVDVWHTPATRRQYSLVVAGVPVASGQVPQAGEADEAGDAFLVNQLEREIWQRLTMVFGVPEGLAVLAQWTRDDAALAARLATLLPDDAARLGMVRLMREALAEPLPLRPAAAYLDALHGLDLRLPEDVATALQRVRLALAARLPGAQSAQRRVALGAALEARLQAALQAGGVLALPMRALAEVAVDLRQRVAAASPDVLVVADPRLRPALHAWLALEHPRVRALSRAEAEAARAPVHGD